MTPHETVSTTTPGDARATAPPPRTFGPQGPTLGDLSDAYLQDYQVRQFRSRSTARGRVAHLTAFFGRAARAATFTTHQIRQYQLARRAAGAATGTINRETSALHRMGTLAVHWGWLDTVPGFPDRLRENPPRQGFFEHPEYLAVRAHLPAPWQDILDLAYYSGWRKQEILGLTWEEIDMAGGVIRLSPARSKTLVGRIRCLRRSLLVMWTYPLARKGAYASASVTGAISDCNLLHRKVLMSHYQQRMAQAPKIGCSSETLRHWVRAVERDTGRRPGLTTDERQRSLNHELG